MNEVFIKLAITNYFVVLNHLVLTTRITFFSNDVFLTSWYLKILYFNIILIYDIILFNFVTMFRLWMIWTLEIIISDTELYIFLWNGIYNVSHSIRPLTENFQPRSKAIESHEFSVNVRYDCKLWIFKIINI